MASKDEHPRQNLMQEALDRVRERYVEEHGEQPPDEFLQKARREILLTVAQKDRDDHRDIYDALADE